MAQDWSPLHEAVMNGTVADVEALLADGADRDAGSFGVPEATPRRFALFYGKVGHADALGGAVEDLREAAALGALDRLNALLARDPLPTKGFGFAGPPQWFPARTQPLDVPGEALAWAARCGQLEAMARLVQAGADVNSNPYRGTPLLWACFSDQVGAATWLLDHGADPDLRHDFGGATHGKAATAMHLAAQYSCLGTLQLLLDRGADTTLTDALYDATPLGWALHENATDAAALLS